MLSNRLSAIAALVPRGCAAADVCADHALLATALAASGRAPRVIAIDIAAAPLALARSNVALHRMEDRVDVRQGDGLTGLAEGEVEVVVIAGIGGRAMLKMLSRRRPEALGVTTLVLQANKRVDRVRAWLPQNGWTIDEEALVEERGRFFEVIRATRALDKSATALPRIDALLGPVSRRRGGVTFDRFVAHTLQWMRAEAEALSHVPHAPVHADLALVERAAQEASMSPATADNVTVRAIGARETGPLRQEILRPKLTLEQLVYPGDDAPLSAHFGAFDGDRMVGIASVYRKDEAGREDGPDWQLRGMGVLPEYQGTGVGAKLIAATFDHARSHGGTRYWCNARVVALGFYERQGLVAIGEEFEVPGVGPHYVMERAL